MKNPGSGPFVVSIDLSLADKLLIGLRERDFEISRPPHTCFSGKKKGIICTLYASGKLVVQGNESPEFIEFFLEPDILKHFSFTHPDNSPVSGDITPRIGIDESGKGDFFGPLCIAGVFVPAEGFSELRKLGVKDSKSLTDQAIKKIGNAIKRHFLHHIVKINPPKYNQIYAEFKNLNTLLAWGHATAIERLVEQSDCRNVIIDQFAGEKVVESALKRKKLHVMLTQRHRGEEDPPVAAASILARLTFIEAMDRLSEEIGIRLPKGCSQATKTAAREVLLKFGEKGLREICKEHFKTLDAILDKERK